MIESAPTFRPLARLLALGWLAVAPLRSGAAVTLGSLLDEMTDPERLTRWPAHGYRLLHASSTDRRSLVPHTADWFANSDCYQFVRVETVGVRTEYVLLDADGPGAIVRFWSTGMGSGDTLRIYLDGSSAPAVEGALAQLIGRGVLAQSPLSFVAPESAGAGTGHNLYLPLPFSQHCKVTVSTPSTRLYYNIDYRKYDAGAEVETYTTNAVSLYQGECARALAALSAGHPPGINTSACHRLGGRLNWGGGCQSVALRGPAAIRLLRFQIAAPDRLQALRDTHLEIDFDGELRAVSCPIGDFFGTGCVVTTGRTWFVECAADGTLSAYWPMPFRERARLRVVNHGQQPVDLLLGEIGTGAYLWSEPESLHFHASWRDYAFEDTVALKGEDLNYATLQGQGRLVGDSLCLFNDASDISDTYRNWWGEGDEKIAVDGEAFPSHFGTGTEDYYGYAWCLPQTYNWPFIAQPTGAGNYKRGQTVNTRLRLLDDLPYRSSLRFDMELLSWRSGRHRFAPTVYWYARPGGCHHTPDPLAKSILPVPRTTSGREAASTFCPIGVRAEAEAMAVTQCSGGAVSCISSNGWGLSGDGCLRWRDCALGSRLDLQFSASFTGQCALVLRLLSGPSAGTLRIGVNGAWATNGVSLFASELAPLLLPLGTRRTVAGANALNLEVTGVPSVTGVVSFAFDYLQNEGPYYIARALPVLRERWEGEQLPALASSGTLASGSAVNALSEGACVLWSGAAVGSSLTFDVVAERPRQVPLAGIFVGTTNGAICTVLVNGQEVCQGLDLHRPAPALTRADLGEHLLRAGTNALILQISGCTNGLDPQNLSAGLDCVDVGSAYARIAARTADTPLIGPLEDPDGDGLINLAEYAFGGDPDLRDGPERWPALSLLGDEAGSYPVITYRRRKPVSLLPVTGMEGVDLQVDGLRYQVQQSASLARGSEWASTNSAGPLVEALGAADDDDGKTLRIRVRSLQPLPAGSPGVRFMRVGLGEP